MLLSLCVCLASQLELPETEILDEALVDLVFPSGHVEGVLAGACLLLKGLCKAQSRLCGQWVCVTAWATWADKAIRLNRSGRVSKVATSGLGQGSV